MIDAFMAAESLSALKKLDLNDRVRRILEQRIGEFEKWLKESEQELRKRYEIEKIYLKNQVSSVRLYARWIKPYLKFAKELEQRAKSTAGLVSAFNTSLLELVLLGKNEYKIANDIGIGILPRKFKDITKKKYYAIVIIEFNFRSAPERASAGGYGYRGRVEMSFTSYALNEEELEILKKELEKDDLGDLMTLAHGATDESLEKIQVDLEEFLEEKPKKKEEKESQDVNPFSALFSFLKKEKKKEEEGIPKDTDAEKVIRSLAILKARKECMDLYNTYKGANNMPNF